MVLTVVYLMSIVNYVTCSFLCFLVNLTRVEKKKVPFCSHQNFLHLIDQILIFHSHLYFLLLLLISLVKKLPLDIYCIFKFLTPQSVKTK